MGLSGGLHFLNNEKVAMLSDNTSSNVACDVADRDVPCFHRMATHEEAFVAKKALNNTPVNGKVMSVNW